MYIYLEYYYELSLLILKEAKAENSVKYEILKCITH